VSSRTLTLAATLVAVTTAGAARADEPATTSATPATNEAWIQCPRCHPEHWAGEPARPFVALRADAGYLYLKPRLWLGYGKPFSIWAGIEAVPLVTPDYAGGFGGLHFQVDWLELRASARYVHAFNRQFLSPMPSYNLVDLAQDTGHPANYVDFEVELSAAVPAGPGNLLMLGTASSIQLVTAGYYVYDEALRVVVSPPPVYRARVGYALPFLPEQNLHVGFIGEVIEIPDRNDRVYRAGITASFDVDDHLQGIATIAIPVAGPDSLGFLGADYSELGIRYRWASGHSDAPQELVPVPNLALGPSVGKTPSR
jgi:hypothetical protein